MQLPRYVGSIIACADGVKEFRPLVEDVSRIQVYVADILLPLVLVKCLQCNELLQPMELVASLYEALDVIVGNRSTVDAPCAADNCNATTCPVCCAQPGAPVSRREAICGEEFPTCFGYIANTSVTFKFWGYCMKCSPYVLERLRTIEEAVATAKSFISKLVCH